MTADAEITLPNTLATLRRAFAAGSTIHAQLYISRESGLVANWAEGSLDGIAITPQTALPWLSAGKPITAVAIAQLWEAGKLDLDDRVASYIPEFAANGKENITIRHILTHTGGFRAVLGEYETNSWEKALTAVCNARLEPGWVVGQTAGYHPTTSWYVLGELIRRLDGRAFDVYARDMIFTPLGMTGTTFGDQPRPGSSAAGPARDLGRFYECLLHRGESILRPQTVEAITARHRAGVIDKSFRHVIDFGLGFIVGSNQYGYETLPYSFGPDASPRSFGHGGARTSIAFCDPERRLVVVIILSRAASEQEHHARMLRVHAALAQDLQSQTRPV